MLLLHWWTHIESIDLVTFEYFFEMLQPIPDLWSLPKQLLLLQPQPLLLDLLQPHLIAASHDSAVGGWQRASLLHWSTLGDPLLVQGCKREGEEFRSVA